MKPFKISNHTQKNRFKWLNWIAVGLGLIHFYMAADIYFTENDLSEAIIDAILGLFWLVFGYVNIFWNEPSIPDITLDNRGITVEKEGNTRLLSWNEIQNINLDNNTISVHLDNGREEELNIWTVEYKELQMLKQKLQQFTAGHNISYSSKY